MFCIIAFDAILEYELKDNLILSYPFINLNVLLIVFHSTEKKTEFRLNNLNSFL